jgi:hypothetical protein
MEAKNQLIPLAGQILGSNQNDNFLVFWYRKEIYITLESPKAEVIVYVNLAS